MQDELFEKARGEILDEIVNLSQLSPLHWEQVISNKLWDKVSFHVFERIYLPSAQSTTSGTFNTQIDINLKQWAEGNLSQKSVDVGWETLKQEFNQLIEKSKVSKDHDNIFDHLKSAVCDEAMKRHAWEEKALEVLKVIQFTALEDRSISTKQQWDSAIQFLENSLKDRLDKSKRAVLLHFG